MFGFFKKNKSESEVVAAYKADNEKLMARLAAAEVSLKQSAVESKLQDERLAEATLENEELREQIKELEGSAKVTYAQARKVLTKAKLKELRAKLEAVPSGASGFQGSVSVYDKKTKRLKVVQLTSKEQALEILSKAEKGNVDIVI